jgi:hypothetical protein
MNMTLIRRFPPRLSKNRTLGALVALEKDSTLVFLARVIREARVRVQDNLETAVEFLPPSSTTGVSLLDPWLRPRAAKMAPLFTGDDTYRTRPLRALARPLDLGAYCVRSRLARGRYYAERYSS